MAWTINYTETALAQLRKLDRQVARQVLDYMEQRVATLEDPRSTGKALTGPLGAFWRYRVADLRVICDLRDGVCQVLVIKIGNRREVYR